jgi:hypothetical protein
VIKLLSDRRFRLGACVVALAIVAGVAMVTRAPAPAAQAKDTGRATRTVVNRTALSCPAPGAGGKVQTVVNAVAPVLPDGTPTAAGNTTPLSIAPLSPTANPVGSVLVRGRLTSTPWTTKLDPLAVRGTGPLAAGTVATSTSIATDGVNRGMASIPCQVPGSDFWFVGASAAPGRRDVLVLTNLDSINAQVDITVYAAGGVQDVPSARGVVVPARGTAQVYLGTVMPKLRDLALHVVSSGGRVAAAVRDNATNGAIPAGVDWLNQSSAPATKVVVPALAPGAGIRTLTVVNPGDLQASATLTVNGPNGPFKPAGISALDIPAGAVKVVRLDSVLNGDPSAVTVTSDQPLTASARMQDPKGIDFASMGSTDPLTDGAAVDRTGQNRDRPVRAPRRRQQGRPDQRVGRHRRRHQPGHVQAAGQADVPDGESDEGRHRGRRDPDPGQKRQAERCRPGRRLAAGHLIGLPRSTRRPTRRPRRPQVARGRSVVVGVEVRVDLFGGQG